MSAASRALNRRSAKFLTHTYTMLVSEVMLQSMARLVLQLAPRPSGGAGVDLFVTFRTVSAVFKVLAGAARNS